MVSNSSLWDGKGGIDPNRQIFSFDVIPGTAAGDKTPATPAVDRAKFVGKLCDGIRTLATNVLQLSTLDGLLVRWAFIHESGVLDKLKSDAGAKDIFDRIGTSDSKIKSVEDLRKVCWSNQDQALFISISKALKITIQ